MVIIKTTNPFPLCVIQEIRSTFYGTQFKPDTYTKSCFKKSLSLEVLTGLNTKETSKVRRDLVSFFCDGIFRLKTSGSLRN